MRVGRNDPCPCGSGLKHKRCCLTKIRVPASAPAEVDPAASARAVEVRSVQGELEPRILDWARRELGDDVIQPAWEDFILGHAGIAPEGPEIQFFEPWLLYEWIPRPPGRRRGRRGSRDAGRLTIAEMFVHFHGAELVAAERDFVEAVVAEPFSFNDVVKSEAGRRLGLRDILRGSERDVVEVSGSQMSRPGDILFARIVPFEGVNLMIGAGSVLIPPTRKGPLLELRRSLRETFGAIDAGLLRELRDELRGHYFQIRELILNPPPPVMLNTDGDPMEFHEITYEVESADAAFQTLSSLAVGEDEEDLTSDARLDAAGRIEEVEFPWLKPGNAMHEGWDNTILGHVRLKGRRMIVEVNSARRARKIQAEIKKRLRGRAVHLETKVRSIEAAMRDRDAARDSSETKRRLREQQDLQEHPEIKEAIRAMLKAHWRNWPERPIPALGGKTPLEAIKDPEGREMVEALLVEAERRDEGQGSVPVDLTPVRRRLGLVGP